MAACVGGMGRVKSPNRYVIGISRREIDDVIQRILSRPVESSQVVSSPVSARQGSYFNADDVVVEFDEVKPPERVVEHALRVSDPTKSVLGFFE